MDWYDQELRRMMRVEKKLQRYGNDRPRCALCGRDDPAGLERHHVAGAANSKLTVWLCRYCHAIVSDRQEGLMPDLRERDSNRDPLQSQAALLQGAAILLILLAIALFAWAAWDVAASTYLSLQHGPDWWMAIPMEEPR